MENTKPWWQSTTMWSGIFTVIAPALNGLAHISLPTDMIPDIANAATMIATGVAGLVTVWGRATAKAKIVT